MEVLEFKERDYNNAVAVIGFPSLGLVSSIASSFIARELKMDLIAGIAAPEFPPYCIIQNGIPMPQVRIFHGCRKDTDMESGLDCEDILIVTSEFIPKQEQYYDIALTLIQWLEKKGIRKVITLDGIPMFTPDTYEIIGAGSSDKAREIMKEYEINPFDDGMVRGISGIMLFEGSRRNMDIITLLGSAKSEFPDPKGAAMLMDPLKKMIPEINIDTEPLYQEASELDMRFNANKNVPSDGIDRIYG